MIDIDEGNCNYEQTSKCQKLQEESVFAFVNEELVWMNASVMI
jgi:hypothetical protein